MAGTDKLFGLILLIAGVAIAAYYTVWQFLSLVSIFSLESDHGVFSLSSQGNTRSITTSWTHIIFSSCLLSHSLQASF